MADAFVPSPRLPTVPKLDPTAPPFPYDLPDESLTPQKDDEANVVDVAAEVLTGVQLHPTKVVRYDRMLWIAGKLERITYQVTRCNFIIAQWKKILLATTPGQETPGANRSKALARIAAWSAKLQIYRRERQRLAYQLNRADYALGQNQPKKGKWKTKPLARLLERPKKPFSTEPLTAQNL